MLGRRFVIGIISFFIIVGLLIGSASLGRTGVSTFIQNWANDTFSLVNRIIGGPIRLVNASSNSLTQLFSTYSENKKLRSKVDQVAQDESKIAALEKENQSLKQMIGVKSTMTNYDLKSAAVISRSPSAWQSEIVISEGSNSGVKVGSPVISGAGLIGKVTQVGTISSKVELLTDTTANSDRFSVQITTSNGQTLNGLITDYDAQQNELVMGNLSSEIEVKSGDKVVTSGLGGNTPNGIFVGTVDKVVSDEYGISKKIMVKTTADFNFLSTVLVVTNVGAGN